MLNASRLNAGALNASTTDGPGEGNGESGDWTLQAPAERQSIYVLEIGELRLPISSAQATMRITGQGFLQAVVPNGAEFIDELSGLLDETMVLRSGYRYADGSLSPLEAIAGAPFQQVRRDQGPQRDTLTLSGYGPRPGGSGLRDLRRVQRRSVETDGRRRVRAELDLLLRPGQQARDEDGTIFPVGVIQYFISAAGEGMEVLQDG